MGEELAKKLKDAGFPELGRTPTAFDILKQLPGYKISAPELEDIWEWQLWSPNFRLVYVGDYPDTMMAEYWLFKNASKKPVEV